MPYHACFLTCFYLTRASTSSTTTAYSCMLLLLRVPWNAEFKILLPFQLISNCDLQRSREHYSGSGNYPKWPVCILTRESVRQLPCVFFSRVYLCRYSLCREKGGGKEIHGCQRNYWIILVRLALTITRLLPCLAQKAHNHNIHTHTHQPHYHRMRGSLPVAYAK